VAADALAIKHHVGFTVLARRWVVERTLASATAFLFAACVMLLIRMLLIRRTARLAVLASRRRIHGLSDHPVATEFGDQLAADAMQALQCER
jgi:hypothetical protein